MAASPSSLRDTQRAKPQAQAKPAHAFAKTMAIKGESMFSHMVVILAELNIGTGKTASPPRKSGILTGSSVAIAGDQAWGAAIPVGKATWLTT